MPNYRVIVNCTGVPSEFGSDGAKDVAAEFGEREWQKVIRCTWGDGTIELEVENDFDPKGLATLDEFSDALSACLPAFDGDISVVSVVRIG